MHPLMRLLMQQPMHRRTRLRMLWWWPGRKLQHLCLGLVG
jgi:hypothetical protein